MLACMCVNAGDKESIHPPRPGWAASPFPDQATGRPKGVPVV